MVIDDSRSLVCIDAFEKDDNDDKKRNLICVVAFEMMTGDSNSNVFGDNNNRKLSLYLKKDDNDDKKTKPSLY